MKRNIFIKRKSLTLKLNRRTHRNFIMYIVGRYVLLILVIVLHWLLGPLVPRSAQRAVLLPLSRGRRGRRCGGLRGRGHGGAHHRRGHQSRTLSLPLPFPLLLPFLFSLTFSFALSFTFPFAFPFSVSLSLLLGPRHEEGSLHTVKSLHRHYPWFL